MAGANKYEDMSVLEALNQAEGHTLLLPDIQREYVWDYTDIEQLFESVVDGYPIGSFIFWKTNKTTINKEKPNLYYFLRDFEREKSENEKAPEEFTQEKDYYIVLDGQQRITSFNIALKGCYKYYKGGKGRSRNDPQFWVSKELYYNLDFYKTAEDEDEENSHKRFVFLTNEEAQNGNYFKVKQLMAYNTIAEFLCDISTRITDKKIIEDLSILFGRVIGTGTGGNGLIHYYCIAENSYDEALNIFVRVNSTGKKLSKTDLLFSTLIDGWKSGKEEIDNLIKSMNSKGDGFAFSRDYLMRLCLVLVDEDTNLKINSLTQKTIKEIRNNWDKIKIAAEKLAILLAEIGLSNETITSYNATMPIAYYLYKGGKVKEKDEKEVSKFLSVAMAKRLFGVASNDALKQTRGVFQKTNCKKTSFSLSLFKGVTLTGGRTFTVTETDIDYWLDNYEKGQSTYLLLSLLYPGYKLSQVAFHQDHCHPHTQFEKANIASLHLSEATVISWQKKRNLLPNLQFLAGKENESKNRTPLIDWIKAGNTIKYQPKKVSLELKDFEDFFKKRRALMKKELANIFGVTLK